MTSYQTRTVDRMVQRVLELQDQGRWEQADSILDLALRWERYFLGLDSQEQS